MANKNDNILKTEEVELQIKGLKCQHCVATVKNKLNELEGISEVKVDLETGKARIIYYASSINIAEIRKTIEETGYRVQ